MPGEHLLEKQTSGQKRKKGKGKVKVQGHLLRADVRYISFG